MWKWETLTFCFCECWLSLNGSADIIALPTIFRCLPVILCDLPKWKNYSSALSNGPPWDVVIEKICNAVNGEKQINCFVLFESWHLLHDMIFVNVKDIMTLLQHY